MSAEMSFASLALGLLLVQGFKAGRKRFKARKRKSIQVKGLSIDKDAIVDKHKKFKAACTRKVADLKHFYKQDEMGSYKEIELSEFGGSDGGYDGIAAVGGQ